MLNKVSVSFILTSPNLNGFGNLKLLNSLLSVLGSKNNLFSCLVSNKLGTNTGFVIKESPFHYPVAKTVLSNSNRLITLKSNLLISGTTYKTNFNSISNLSKSIFNVFILRTNSLLTHKKTTVSIYINYRPFYSITKVL